MEDHLHIVTHLHPSVSLADLVKNIKIASSGFIKDNRIFKKIEYVKNQEKHHKIVSFQDEYIELLREHDIEFDEKYLL